MLRFGLLERDLPFPFFGKKKKTFCEGTEQRIRFRCVGDAGEQCNTRPDYRMIVCSSKLSRPDKQRCVCDLRVSVLAKKPATRRGGEGGGLLLLLLL